MSGCLLLWWYGRHMISLLGLQLRDQLGAAGSLRMNVNDVAELNFATALSIGQLLLPVFVCVFCAALVANLTQGGLVWAPSRIEPDLSRLQPGRRVASLVSWDRVVDAGLELLKMSVCLSVAGLALWAKRDQLAVGQESVYASFASAARCIFEVLFLALAALGSISLVEYWLTTLRHRKSLRMTAEEWQAEMKESEAAMSVKQMRKFATGNPSSDAE